jgi:hypothetical protein
MSAAMITPPTIARRFTPITAIVLTMIACGPPGFEGGSTDGDETDTDSSTSTSTSTDTETGSEDPISTISGFLPNLDEPQLDECDSFLQDCPDGEKCVPYASAGGNWDANKCVAIMGNQATGEACISGGVVEATDDCDGTGFCWHVVGIDGEMLGICHAFCMGSPDDPQCPPGSNCAISSDGPIALCIPTCDPLLQDCDDGFGCYWANDFNCIFTAANIPVGQPCGYINDCAPGLACLIAEVVPACEGSACCSAFCNLELGDAPCDATLAGTACVPFFEEGMAQPSHEHIGVCILPP